MGLSNFWFVSLTYPNPVLNEYNLIRDKIPVIGLDIVERQV